MFRVWFGIRYLNDISATLTSFSAGGAIPRTRLLELRDVAQRLSRRFKQIEAGIGQSARATGWKKKGGLP